MQTSDSPAELLGALWPPPRRARSLGGSLGAVRPRPRGVPGVEARWELARSLVGGTPADLRESSVACSTDPALERESYVLSLRPDGSRLVAGSELGLFRGLTTLAQLCARAGAGPLPCVEVEDAPRFGRRGVMLDVSRDRVPRVETLRAIVDRLAAWKVDQLQLYTEHTFAYAGHEEVWRDASPLTPEEVRELDAYCRARAVELVPNQQSFGHFHRWLVHERYRPLAECPEGVVHPFATEPEPFSLCPTDPRSLALLEELWDQLLPCFASDTLNAGLDETFDLGLGRSARDCQERGKGRVYLEFLEAVRGRLAARGVHLQYWADVALSHPELLDELPRDATALLWGYDAEHPFEEQARALAEGGLPFYVCPGTSAWQSFGGRARNALANLRSAARHGAAHGALGYLVTDWGDRGHHQPLPVSWLGLWYGAGCAWSGEEALPTSDDDVAAGLSDHAFGDPGGATGRAALLLADVGHATRAGSVNGTAPFFLLSFVADPLPHERMPALDAAGLERGLARLDEASGALAEARPEDGLVLEELAWVRDVLGFACRFGLARLAAGPGAPASAIDAATRRALAAELGPLVERHRGLWLARSRPGGLDASCAWLERVLAALGAPA